MSSIVEKFIEDLNDPSSRSILEPSCIKHNVKTSINACYGYDLHYTTTTENYDSTIKKIKDSSIHCHDRFKDFLSDSIQHKDNKSFKLLTECNQIINDINQEIKIVHNINKDIYRSRFPELESLVQNPIEYAKIIQKVGNEKYISQVELAKVLTSSNLMVIAVTAIASNGEPLTEDNLNKVMEGSQIVLKLDSNKELVLSIIEKEIKHVAPNLSMVLGPEIASKLISMAGGIIKFSKIPACNIKALGSKRMKYGGFSISPADSSKGIIYGCKIIQQTPIAWREKAIKYVSSKIALLSKIDAYSRDTNCYVGRKIYEKILNEIERWQEPIQTSSEKPLPIPDGTKRSRRGGRRLSKQTSRNEMLSISKATNKINFFGMNTEKSDWDDFMSPSIFGNSTEIKLNYKVKKNEKSDSINVKDSRKKTISNSSSPLALTPVQGIELTSRNLGRECDMSDGFQTYLLL